MNTLDLEPSRPDDLTPDPDLTDEQISLVRALKPETLKEIDDLILSHAKVKWRKVAMIVMQTMRDFESNHSGLPDVFFAQQIKKLVERGCLQSQGNLQYMRYSEVRLPSKEQ